MKYDLGKFIMVENMTNERMNTVPNQFIITFEKGMVFQSYKSIIAIKTNDKTYIGGKYKYSNTTGKYRNIFLGEELRETEIKIKKGIYIYDKELK